MSGDLRLKKLEVWLKETGRSKRWFADAVRYSYQQAHSKMAGKSPLNDRFVVACFVGIPELPRDIFERHGYVREDGVVCKRIALQVTTAES